MGKRESAAWIAWVGIGLAGTAHADTRLTEREQRWVEAMQPVVAYARGQGLPVDIVVQPSDTPGIAPVAMGHVNGRCKLVVSMRANPLADDTERHLPPDLFRPVAEAIAAHEMAHCWREVRGGWRGPPDTDDALPADADPDLRTRWTAMRATRREEGFADLVGLAWTWRQHPQAYARVHAWFSQERADPPFAGSHHDTRAWLRLAARGGFVDGVTPFDQVADLWAAGVAAAPRTASAFRFVQLAARRCAHRLGLAEQLARLQRRARPVLAAEETRHRRGPEGAGGRERGARHLASITQTVGIDGRLHFILRH